MKHRLRLVLDTNIFLVSISSKSAYHWIFEALLADEFDLCLTHDILLEYEEIIGRKFNPHVAQDVMRALLELPNVYRVNVFFQWRLISNDPDDNKFADCAVSANADYIVSNDRDYRLLNTIDFPPIRVLTIAEFSAMFQKRRD